MCLQKGGKEIREWTFFFFACNHLSLFFFLLMCQNDGLQAVHRLMFNHLS